METVAIDNGIAVETNNGEGGRNCGPIKVGFDK